MQVNLLNEISMVSAMKATTALSKFLQIPFGVDMNPIVIKEIEELNKINCNINVNDDTINLYIPIMGNLSGASYFIFTPENALSFCDLLLHQIQGTTTEFMEKEQAALLEVANVVLGNFLTSFAHSLQMDFLMHSSGEFHYSTFANLLIQQIPLLTKNIEKYVVELCFNFQFNDIKGHVLVVFDKEKIDAMLESSMTALNQ